MDQQWILTALAFISSSMIVFFINTWIRRIGDQSDKVAASSLADREILYALRPYIAENGLPELEVIDALINSTARRHGLNPLELTSVRIICEDLIREILEDVYMPVSKKQEYTKRLRSFLIGPVSAAYPLISDTKREIARTEGITRSYYRNKVLGSINAALSVIAGLASCAAFYAFSLFYGQNALGSASLACLGIIAAIGLIYTCLVLYSNRVPMGKPRKQAPEAFNQEQDAVPPTAAAPAVIDEAESESNEDAYYGWDSAESETIETEIDAGYFDISPVDSLMQDGNEQAAQDADAIFLSGPAYEETTQEQEAPAKPKRTRKKKAEEPESPAQEETEES
ncbi:MAG: hypothetical protein FWG30_07665 [Eubacteriaceae bacterium]|nr:hypothetical protein [Eubacteriaceae bacterium]